MLRIDNWSCTTRGDQRWLAPEQIRLHLQGTVKNHPTVHVTTSYVVSVTGRKVTTKSGNVYVLGRIDKHYRKWLRKHRPNWNWRQPITEIGS